MADNLPRWVGPRAAGETEADADQRCGRTGPTPRPAVLAVDDRARHRTQVPAPGEHLLMQEHTMLGGRVEPGADEAGPSNKGQVPLELYPSLASGDLAWRLSPVERHRRIPCPVGLSPRPSIIATAEAMGVDSSSDNTPYGHKAARRGAAAGAAVAALLVFAVLGTAPPAAAQSAGYPGEQHGAGPKFTCCCFHRGPRAGVHHRRHRQHAVKRRNRLCRSGW